LLKNKVSFSYQFRRRHSIWFFFFLVFVFSSNGFEDFVFASLKNTNKQTETRRALQREQMVEDQIQRRGITNENVIVAMKSVQRHLFVPQNLVNRAYEDNPLPIGFNQTISQPFVVAYMTEIAALTEEAKVLEIGTGSGYQTAVLAEIVSEVFSIEIIPELAIRSRNLLDELGYRNLTIKSGDGYQGWPEEAPFDAIVVTAAPNHVPPALIEQLAVGGKLVIPVGQIQQEMTIITKTDNGASTVQTLPVRFVPMTGEAQEQQTQR
tara:strand:+ start:2755 stop:3549 length:795 start_codon:yes stop_codon:yes gene_type:complete